MRYLVFGSAVMLLAAAALMTALNPGLVWWLGGGVILGIVVLFLFDAARPRHDGQRRSRAWRWIGCGVLIFVFTLAAMAGGLLFSMRLPIIDPTVVRGQYAGNILFQEGGDAWHIEERYTLSEAALAEVVRLLRRDGAVLGEDALPEEVATEIAHRLHDGWSVGLDTGNPVLSFTRTQPLPSQSHTAATATISISAPSADAFNLLPAAGSSALIVVPRHLLVDVEPVGEPGGLQGEPRETRTVPIGTETREIKLRIAPAWARNDVLFVAMRLSFAGITSWVVALAVAVLTTVTTALLTGRWKAFSSWLRRKLRRPAPVQMPPPGP